LTVSGPSDDLARLTSVMPGFSLSAVESMPAELADIRVGLTAVGGETRRRWREATDGDGQLTRVPVSDEEAAALTARFGAADWWDWSATHWGTKWDIVPARWETARSPVDDGEEVDAVRAVFTTAWSAPFPAVAALAAAWPTLTFVLAFLEEAGPAGAALFRGGEPVDRRDVSVGERDVFLATAGIVVAGPDD
jgi:hypothetical protein